MAFLLFRLSPRASAGVPPRTADRDRLLPTAVSEAAHEVPRACLTRDGWGGGQA